MKSDIELKAIAFDRYMDAANSDGASMEMKVASITLNACYSAEKHKDTLADKASQYGEGKVKEFDPEQFITVEDSTVTCSRYIKRFGKGE